VYGASLVMLRRMLALQRPDAVLCLGLAGGRKRLSFETRAVNIDDARIPDNDGQKPGRRPIRPGGPAALPPTLPLGHIARGLRRASLPLEFSPSAGTFLCNHVFYGLMDWIYAEDPSVMGGFVHVPWIEEQRSLHPGAPSAELEQLVLGVRETIAVMVGT
jgi:pyroglutamyl-peptidase